MTLFINTADNRLVEVSLKKDGEEIKKLTEQNQFGSQVLLPLIARLLKEEKLEFNELTAIEVAEGPGSFTGLRVGATVAQALGYVLKIPVNGRQDHLVELKYI